MNYGELFKKKRKASEAIEHFTEAFLIYQNYFGTNSLQAAEAATQLASLMQDECRFDEAFEYAEIASNTFRNVYSSVHYKSIQSLWSLLSISYALHKARPREEKLDINNHHGGEHRKEKEK